MTEGKWKLTAGAKDYNSQCGENTTAVLAAFSLAETA